MGRNAGWATHGGRAPGEGMRVGWKMVASPVKKQGLGEVRAWKRQEQKKKRKPRKQARRAPKPRRARARKKHARTRAGCACTPRYAREAPQKRRVYTGFPSAARNRGLEPRFLRAPRARARRSGWLDLLVILGEFLFCGMGYFFIFRSFVTVGVAQRESGHVV